MPENSLFVDWFTTAIVANPVSRSGASPQLPLAAATLATTAPIVRMFWVAALACVAPALVLWRETFWLAAIAFGLCAVYIVVYLWLKKLEVRRMNALDGNLRFDK